LITNSESETITAGRLFAATLNPGDVVLLSGALGAGKTAFVRGMAGGLGADPEVVTSPTFTLIQEYPGAETMLYHVDLFRLEPHEVDDLGLQELMGGEAIVAIEWPERLPRPIADAKAIVILQTGPTRREILIQQPEEQQRD
jgi:tRNA threonylcarbamoyladenosine biosynthesis protein TsaE